MSAGWLLDGSQPIAPYGSLTTKPPEAIRAQPSVDPSGSITGSGAPTNLTTVTNVRPFTIPAAGVITSLSSTRAVVAGTPSIVTSETV